ncbi:hypothetical protein GCM10007205_19500 [Oxalicibacterium flavum]|uniref:Uncharacterized protein n=1 Tax=Oxalicibacterium flavum TaxID=179467 RepID=A0A8J2UMZ1_9BURK|nr:hypothetical protein [Oxalicibacterium flavum]GGC10481.1 hypothetical protein GCM10007205_19500 [Oxalicibacterium flavum]
MSKFKIKMKITGFELEIEGSRDDVPGIQQAIGRQLGGLLQPNSGLVDSSAEPEIHELKDITPETTIPEKKRRKRATPSISRSSTTVVESETPVNWPRDITPFGVPSQDWVTSDKALWVLYVAKEHGEENELTAKRICDTFNSHCRQAGVIKVGNINRDLGRLKMKSKPFVGEDTTKNPPVWYLTQSGNSYIQDKISKAQAAE